jgi:hypothetical protein
MNKTLIATLLLSTFAVLSLSACSDRGHEDAADGRHSTGSRRRSWA